MRGCAADWVKSSAVGCVSGLLEAGCVRACESSLGDTRTKPIPKQAKPRMTASESQNGQHALHAAAVCPAAPPPYARTVMCALQACYKSAWTLAAATNVGRMQTAYQHRKHNARDDGVYYYGTTDYYAANTLFYAYGVRVRHCTVSEKGSVRHGGGRAFGVQCWCRALSVSCHARGQGHMGARNGSRRWGRGWMVFTYRMAWLGWLGGLLAGSAARPCCGSAGPPPARLWSTGGQAAPKLNRVAVGSSSERLVTAVRAASKRSAPSLNPNAFLPTVCRRTRTPSTTPAATPTTAWWWLAAAMTAEAVGVAATAVAASAVVTVAAASAAAMVVVVAGAAVVEAAAAAVVEVAAVETRLTYQHRAGHNGQA